MLKNTSKKRNNFYKNFSKKKILFKIVSSTFLLFIIFFIYLVYNDTFYKTIISDSNTSIIRQSKSAKDFQKNYQSIEDKNSYQNISSFNTLNLVNDNRGIPVLYYHSVREPADNEVTITPKNLRIQLEYIKNQGYVTLTLRDLKNYLLDNSPIPEKSILITFDDGYMDNYYNAFPILKDLNMMATIFCITSNLDGSYYLSKEAIYEMSNYGIDIESHTINHPKLNQLTYEEQLKEFKESKKTLEEITGKEVIAIAYPFGNFNNDSLKAATNSGYTLGFTTKRGFSDRNDNILELDRIYISSKYDMNTFKEVLSKTEK